MGIGVSVLLLAAGAVLTFALEAEIVEGVDINAVGVILMIAGAIGLIIALVAMNRRTTVVEERPTVRRRIYDDPMP